MKLISLGGYEVSPLKKMASSTPGKKQEAKSGICRSATIQPRQPFGQPFGC
jgi:hypothetical protein